MHKWKQWFIFVSSIEQAIAREKSDNLACFSYIENIRRVKMKERIQQIMQREGLSPSRFAEEIGIQRSAMSHIISGRNNPSLDVVMKILERFKYIQSDWLLTGQGTMLRKESADPTDSTSAPSHILPEVQVQAENCKEKAVETPIFPVQAAVFEKVTVPEKPPRSVTKIVVFYSDNTYETFKLEKSPAE